MKNETGFDARWNGKSIPKKHWHFHQQLLARYDIILAPGEFSQMLRDIESGHATVIEHQHAARIIYMIRNTRLWERYFVLVTSGHVVTALPPSKRLKKLRRELPR